MNLIVLEEPGEQWDEFVSAHSRLIFHTSVWWRILKRATAAQPDIWCSRMAENGSALFQARSWGIGSSGSSIR